jgi:beta-glucuronidase
MATLPCIAATPALRSPVTTFLAVLAAAALPASAAAQAELPPEPGPAPAPELVVDRPEERVLIHEGQEGRLLLSGRWYFRQDDSFVGDAQRWYAQRDLVGWTPVRVPDSWNRSDLIANRPTVGWYRKEFVLPDQRGPDRRLWKVRFEGSNYRTTVWLNGRRLGRFGGYFPFELDLTGLRDGRNTLVAKVSTLRGRTDLTHWRPTAVNGYGSGGWWNSGGLLREVYVRPVDMVDIEDVQVLPRLRCVRCRARVEVRALLRNVTLKDRSVKLTLTVGGPSAPERIELRPETVPARDRRELVSHFVIERPRLWQPGHPYLYRLAVTAGARRKRRAGYRLDFGVRKLDSRGAVLRLNGRPLRLRGASIHEDDARTGAALTPATRALLVNRLRDLGATVTRSHYPLHPAFLEAFDRYGILYWVQAPVYQLPGLFFDLPGVRRAATRAVERTVRNNLNHPSVLAWSLANEPAGHRSELGVIGPNLVRYVREASAAARELDDTRPIAIDRQSRVLEPITSPAYAYLDVLGLNEYFGWYDSFRADLQRGPTTTAELGDFLDSVHEANPDLPLVVTEFGAEATRSGPVEQPGTYEFQRKFVLDHLAVHASKPYVNGSIVWALRDFRVEPSWHGGAPPDYAKPPWHNKSLIEETNWRKPVYFSVRKRWRRTNPLGR